MPKTRPLVAAGALLAAALFEVAPASAQTVLTYTRGGPLPAASIEAPDGRVFELKLTGSDGDYALSLLRAGHRGGARNQLEPSADWHGLWPFMIMADDLAPKGRWIYGPRRDIPLRDYPFHLRVELRDIELTGAGPGNGGAETFDFKRLVLTAELRPDR